MLRWREQVFPSTMAPKEGIVREKRTSLDSTSHAAQASVPYTHVQGGKAGPKPGRVLINRPNDCW